LLWFGLILLLVIIFISKLLMEEKNLNNESFNRNLNKYKIIFKKDFN